MINNKLKIIFLKSITFLILYIAGTVAKAYYKDGVDIMDTLLLRWYEYIILFLVMIGFNYYADKKKEKANKHKFYKEL
ncbi:MAG: hypothetical protein KAG96_04115 [Ichthyobacteriaceae bacterium]|nr:hypothetical protein [Ichthyobacteriaceae bacterium]